MDANTFLRKIYAIYWRFKLWKAESQARSLNLVEAVEGKEERAKDSQGNKTHTFNSLLGKSSILRRSQ